MEAALPYPGCPNVGATAWDDRYRKTIARSQVSSGSADGAVEYKQAGRLSVGGECEAQRDADCRRAAKEIGGAGFRQLHLIFQ